MKMGPVLVSSHKFCTGTMTVDLSDWDHSGLGHVLIIAGGDSLPVLGQTPRRRVGSSRTQKAGEALSPRTAVLSADTCAWLQS